MSCTETPVGLSLCTHEFQWEFSCSQRANWLSINRPSFAAANQVVTLTSLTNEVKKGSPYLITVRRVPELIPVLGSQPADDVSHKPGARLPLLSARPTVTPAKGCYQFHCLVNRGTMGVNSLPKIVTGQRRDCELNPGPSTAPECSTLTTRLPSHPMNQWTRRYSVVSCRTTDRQACRPTSGVHVVAIVAVVCVLDCFCIHNLSCILSHARITVWLRKCCPSCVTELTRSG